MVIDGELTRRIGRDGQANAAVSKAARAAQEALRASELELDKHHQVRSAWIALD